MTPDSDPRAYQAIDPKDQTRRRSLEIRKKDGRRYWLKYADRHMMALRPDATALTAWFYSMSMVIVGQNLTEVATAIDGENIAWLQEFDPSRWDMPTDSGAIIIEKIELYQPKASTDDEKGAIPIAVGDGAPKPAKH